jgi:hypothetical protein
MFMIKKTQTMTKKVPSFIFPGLQILLIPNRKLPPNMTKQFGLPNIVQKLSNVGRKWLGHIN